MEGALDINAIKGDVPEHFDIFRTPLGQLYNNARNGFLPRLPKPRIERGRRTTYFRALYNWAFLPNELKRPMPNTVFKRDLNTFSCGLF